MRVGQTILIPRTAGTITTHRRSRIVLAMLGVALAASIAPGVASASHGRPHPETYLDDLQRHLAIEYPGTSGSQPVSDTILAGLQQRLALEYPADAASQASPNPLLDGRQQQLAIEYPGDIRSGRGKATHFGPPGR
jgi:hypothetical protein